MTVSRPIASLMQQASAFEREGRPTDALQLLWRASSETGDEPGWHRAIAQAAMRLGDRALALSQMQRAVELAGEDTDLRFQLACLLAHQGLHGRALGHFETAASRRPGDAQILHLLGVTLQRLGRNGDALAPLRQAHHLAPANERILEALAESEFHGGHPDDALPLWQAVLRVRPDDTGVIQRAAETLNRLGRSSEALELLREATARQPRAAELWMAMAQTAEDLGDRQAARDAYGTALTLRPDWAFPVSGLLALDRGKASDTLVEQARRLLAGTDLADADRALLGYELGKALDGRGLHDQAMDCWDTANAARRRMTGAADPNAFMRQAERVMARTVRTAAPQDVANGGEGDRRPVFIVGMPRSGTTLTEQILATHPLAHGCGELPDLVLIARALAPAASSDSAWAEPALEQPESTWDAARERYLRAASRNAAPDAMRLVDKAPLNFFHLDLVARLFPHAHVVWCRRDPRDIAVSIYGENFSLEEKLSTDLADIGHYINLQTRLMRHWQAHLSLPILELRYEDLIADPEQQARRLVEFVGLPWDPACLDFHRSERAVQTPSRWQVKQPIHNRSIGRWRHYADRLSPLLEVLEADSYFQPVTPNALATP